MTGERIKRSFPRAIARRLIQLVIVLITIAVITGIVSITLFYSDWGQDRLRVYLERTLSAEGHRSVAIGELSIALSGTVTARDIAVRDRHGADAITIGRAELDLQLRPLLSRAIIIDSLIAVNCAVILDLDETYRSNLQGLLPPPPDDGPGMDLVIDQVHVRRGHLAISRATDQERTALAELRVAEVNGRFESSSRRKQLAITRSLFHWDEHGLSATAVASVALDRGQVTIDNLTVTRGESRAVGSGLSLAIDDGAISGVLQGSLARDDLPWLCQHIAAVAPYQAEQCGAIVARIPSDVTIDHAIVRRSLAGAPWNIETSMRSADTSLGAEVTLHTGDTSALRGAVELRGIPPELVLGDALPGQIDAPIDLTIDVDLSGDPASAPEGANPGGAGQTPAPAGKLRGTLTFTLRTRHRILGAIDCRFTLQPGRRQAELEFHTSASGEAGSSAASAGNASSGISVDGSATYSYDKSPFRPTEIARARLYGNHLPLTRLVEGRIAGTLTSFQARAQGPWSGLELRGSATVARLAHRTAGSIRRARIDFTVASIVGDDIMAGIWPGGGGVRLQVFGARRGDHHIDAASARGTVSYRDGRLRARFTSHASGVRIAASERTIIIARIAGSASAAWHRGNWNLNLGRYQFTTGDQDWRGRGGRIAGRPGGRIDIDQIVALSDYGQFSIDGFLADEKQRDEILLGVTELDLAAVAAIWGLPLRGTASGLARIAGRREGKRRLWQIAGDTEFTRLAWRPDAPAIEGAAHIDLEPGRLSGDLVVREPASDSRLRAEFDMQPPADPFDAAAWRTLDLGRITRAAISSQNLDLDAAYAVLAPGQGNLHGLLSGTVELRGGATPQLAFSLDTTRATVEAGARRYRQLAVRLSGQWNQAGLSTTATLRHRGEVLLGGEGSLAIGLPALWRDALRQPASRTRHQLLAAPLRATIRADGVEISRFSDAGWLDLPQAPASQAGLQGQLVGSLEVTGSLDRPIGRIRDTAIQDFYAAGIGLERIAITADIQPGQLTAEVTGSQIGRGTLRARGTYHMGHDSAHGSARTPALDVEVTATAVDLSFARAFATGRADIFAGATGLVDASLRIRGAPDQPIIGGQVSLRDGGLWLAGGSRRVHGVQAKLEIDRGLVEIRTLKGWLDRGRLEATGVIGLEGATPRTFRGRVRSRDLAILLSRYTAEISGQGQLTGSYRDGTIDAALTVDPGARVVVREIGHTLQVLADLADVVYVDSEVPGDAAGSQDGSTVPGDPANHSGRGHGPVETIRVRVVSTSGASPARGAGGAPAGPGRRGVTVVIDDLFQLVDADIESRVNLDLEFRRWSLSAISGRIRAIAGEAEVLEYKYRIEKGQLAWEGRSFIPSIDMELIGEFPVATVFANLSGSLIEPERTLRSEPPHDETTILAIINGADPDDPDSVDGATLSASADLLLLGTYRRRLPTLVRPDVVRIYANGFAIGKRWFSRAVLVGYRYRGEPEARENQNEVNVRVRIRRDLLIEAQYGDRDIGGLDLLWRVRF